MWSTEHNQAFRTAKEMLTSNPVLAFFDSRKPTQLCTDASKQGLGFILQQQDGNNSVLIQAGSRFLSDPKSRYAVIELELLAVAWAITNTNCKLSYPTLYFAVITDHHPLIPILNSHQLDEIEDPRLQHLETRVMAYNFTAE